MSRTRVAVQSRGPGNTHREVTYLQLGSPCPCTGPAHMHMHASWPYTLNPAHPARHASWTCTLNPAHPARHATLFPAGLSVIGLYVFCADSGYLSSVNQLCTMLGLLASHTQGGHRTLGERGGVNKPVSDMCCVLCV